MIILESLKRKISGISALGQSSLLMRVNSLRHANPFEFGRRPISSEFKRESVVKRHRDSWEEIDCLTKVQVEFELNLS